MKCFVLVAQVPEVETVGVELGGVGVAGPPRLETPQPERNCWQLVVVEWAVKMAVQAPRKSLPAQVAEAYSGRNAPVQVEVKVRGTYITDVPVEVEDS